MTDMTNQQREAFEAWARDNVGQPSFSGKFVRDGAWSYSHNFMDAHWRCWQAATAAERERAAKVCDAEASDDDSPYPDQWDAGWRSGAKACAAEIRKG